MGLLKTFKTLPLDVERGADVWVWDSAGRRYLDLYAGHAVCSTGHCHPKVVAAIQQQAATLIFYSNVAGSPLRDAAAGQLLAHAPHFSSVLFANSGAEANENALKMARRHTGREHIVAMDGGFHGRTAGAMSVTGVAKYRATSQPLLPGVTFVPFGEAPRVGTDVAAVIVEPVQSMAGMKTAPPSWFHELRAACDAAGALLIFDEVQTGIGRTGSMFFSGRDGVDADLVTLAKGIGSGFPLSAVLATAPVAASVQYGEYGATYGAGPLAMAAMQATLEVVDGLLPSVREVGGYLAGRCAAVAGVAEVRGLGLLLGLKLQGGADAGAAQRALLDAGFITGTADEPSVLRLLPPLTLTREHVDAFVPVLESVLQALAAPVS
jgi:acetylornithine/N-succinyldiaminopimelate aminotransferase